MLIVVAMVVDMEVIVVMFIMDVGIEVSCGDKSSSGEPNSFSSFSNSSSWVDSGGWPSCWASWIRRCLDGLVSSWTRRITGLGILTVQGCRIARTPCCSKGKGTVALGCGFEHVWAPKVSAGRLKLNLTARRSSQTGPTKSRKASAWRMMQ